MASADVGGERNAKRTTVSTRPVAMKAGHRVRLGAGELDSSDEHFSGARYVAWTQYLLAAARVKPRVIASLLSDEGFEAFRQTRENRENWVHKPEWSNLPVSPGPDDPLERFIKAWCQQWGMLREFAGNPAHNLLGKALRCRANGEPEPQTFTTDCVGMPLDSPEQHPLYGVGISVSSPQTGYVCVSGIGSGAALGIDLPGLTWNPTEETHAAALTRIMATIAPQVVKALEVVRDAYIAEGHQPVQFKDEMRHFEWLARYQLLGAKKREIARSEGLAERHIRRELSATAHLLGIELRVQRPGRPPRKTARTVTLRKKN